jgi:hypothetical protein
MLTAIVPVPATFCARYRILNALVVLAYAGGLAANFITAMLVLPLPTSVGTLNPVIIKETGAVNHIPLVLPEYPLLNGGRPIEAVDTPTDWPT